MATPSRSISKEGLSLTLKLADPMMGTLEPLAAVTWKAGFWGLILIPWVSHHLVVSTVQHAPVSTIRYPLVG